MRELAARVEPFVDEPLYAIDVFDAGPASALPSPVLIAAGAAAFWVLRGGEHPTELLERWPRAETTVSVDEGRRVRAFTFVPAGGVPLRLVARGMVKGQIRAYVEPVGEPAGSTPGVFCTDEGVSVVRPSGDREEITWDALSMVRVLRREDGVFYVLSDIEETVGVVVPVAAAGPLEAEVRALPGLDAAALDRAVAGEGDERTTVWLRP